MANIIDYIKWRGDLTFRERPFNEIDNLVFALCSYFDFSGSVPKIEEEKEAVTVEMAYQVGRNRKQRVDDMELLKYMAEAPRYKNLLLSNYVDIFDHKQEKTQFSCICITLDENTEYVAFRGTDDSIVGWQEDFSMSFQVIPAQRYAEEYLQKILVGQKKNVYVGGHSKGGNLALYATLKLPKNLQDHVSVIYSNDGPGLCPDIVSREKQKEILSKLICIVPEFSIIGALFEVKPPEHIVKSSVQGVMEHDAYTWQVKMDTFEECKTLTETCKYYNRIFEEWIENVEMLQRQIFIKDFFGALEKGGAIMMNDVVAGGFKKFEDVLFTLGRSKKESKFVVGKLLKYVLKGIARIDIFEMIKNQKLMQGASLLLLGILFVCFQEFAAKIVGIVFFLWMLLYSAYRLLNFYQKFKKREEFDKYKAVFYSVITGIEILCIIKNNIILISVNLILGGFFLWHSWRDMKVMSVQRAYNQKIWILYFIDCMISGIFGIVSFAISSRGSGEFSLVAGSYLLLWGFLKVILAMYQNERN